MAVDLLLDPGLLLPMSGQDAQADDKLPKMQHPILVCWGDDAPGIRLQYGIEAFQLAANGRLVVTYGGDHSAMGFNAREVESQIVAFLTDKEVKPAK